MPAKPSALTRYLRKVIARLALLGCLFVIATAIWAAVATQTYTYSFRLRTPGGPPTADQLEETAQVLSTRLKAMRRTLKVGRGSVTALPPDRIQMQLRDRAEPVHAVAWLTLSGHTAFHLLHPVDDILEQEGAEGLPPQYQVKVYRKQQYVLSRPGDLETVEEAYAVQREPALAITGFQTVSIETVGLHKMVILTFQLRPEDAEAFARLTALNAGRRMAMLIDGEMFFPPRAIGSAARSGAVQVQGYFYMPPVRKLVKLLNCGSLPGSLHRLSDPGDQ